MGRDSPGLTLPGALPQTRCRYFNFNFDKYA